MDQSWNLFKKQLLLSVPGKKVQKLQKVSSSPSGLFRVHLFYTVVINENTE